MTGNSPIGGPNYNQNIARLPSNASGTPAAETGAQFNTTDAVNLGPSSLAPSGADTRGPAVQPETLRPQARTSPGVNNNPTVLTVGDLSASEEHHHPEILRNGLGMTYFERMPDANRSNLNTVVAGQKPLEN